MIAIKDDSNDLPSNTGMDNRVNTITAAAGARRAPTRTKTGKPAGTGRPAPATYVVQKGDHRRDREEIETKRHASRTVWSKNYGSNDLPSDTGINNYVNTNIAAAGADKVWPRPQTDGPARTGHSALPAVGPSRGRPQLRVAVGPSRDRPQLRVGVGRPEAYVLSLIHV